MISKGKGLASAILVSSLFLSGCGSSGADEGSNEANASRSGQELRVAYHADASSLDPIKGNSGNDHSILYSIYDTLVSFDPESLEPQPGLAESWDASDPNQLVMKLREGVKFHDGTDLTADVVKLNLERAMSETSNIAAELESVESVEVLDDYSVQLNLSEPNSALLMILSDRAGMMVSAEQINNNEASIATNPIGSGPWEFEEWSRQTSISGIANSDYWNTEVQIAPKITFRILTDPKTRLDALASGQVDFAAAIAPSDAETVENNDSLNLGVENSLRLRILYVDTAEEWFNDEELRQAFNLAIDRAAIVESGYFGYGEEASTLLSATHWASVEDEVEYEYDPDAAREIFSEKGIPDEPLSIALTNDSDTVRLGEIVRSNLNDVGVQVELQARESTQGVSEYFEDRQHPAYLSLWTGRPDPSQTYEAVVGGEGYYNVGGEEPPELGSNMTSANSTYDQDERLEYLSSIGKDVFESSFVVPLVAEQSVFAYRDGVTGFTPNLLGKPIFSGVIVE